METLPSQLDSLPVSSVPAVAKYTQRKEGKDSCKNSKISGKISLYLFISLFQFLIIKVTLNSFILRENVRNGKNIFNALFLL